MTSAGTIDAALVAKLPKSSGKAVLPNETQTTQIGQTLVNKWATTVGK